MTKPKNIEEYKTWLKKELGFDITQKFENHYNSIASKVLNDFQQSEAWKNLIDSLAKFSVEYYAKTNYQLLTNDFKPILVTKSWNSFFEKTYRRNIVFNKNFPAEPYGGWVTPENWIENTNDILRTFFVVKYLDGVEFLMNKICESLKSNALKCKNHYEARDEGYYAVHIYTQDSFEIPKIDWDTESKTVKIELQITTQLQEVIGKLTHQMYESRRVKIDKLDKKWQWDYESEEFTTNYLGHILHYVEGMIMEVRNKQSKSKN